MEATPDIKTYINKAIQNQNLVIEEIILTGSGEKSDGYASDFTFAKVVATATDGAERTIEIAVKCSKKNFIATNRNTYKREAYFYDVILPEFTSFQIQNGIENVFDSVPKCYKIISDEVAEVIVMENLKKSGYALYDRKKALDLDHLKIVLREYGKFHAISFALRERSKGTFEKLFADFDDVTLEFFNESFKKTMQQCFERACDVVRGVDDKKLDEICSKILENGADVAMVDILKTVEPESAILHGDCWSNNFLYKYEGRTVPSKVAIIDWQLSRLHSPVLDLSYFIYSTSSEEQLKHFDELLDTYYASFSEFLTNLGCDPQKLFPFSSIRMHWKKYSLMGLLLTTTFLHMTICDEEEVPEFTEAGDLGEKVMNVNIKDVPEYNKRLVAVIRHYCNCSKVSILDWQLSRLHSPVLDLSYLIYGTCSEEQLNHFDELMDTYHASFSTFLKELGCDPEELFPYSTLRRHWKKYSAFGFLMVTSFFHIMTCEKEEAPEFSDNVGNVEDFVSIINNVHVKDEAAYQKRIMAIVNHYCKYSTTD